MKIAFKTFGCKANSTDTDALYLEARRRGHLIVEETEVADAYVINSCTVTLGADRDARLEANRCKRKNPLSLVAVIGCYAQVAREELLDLPEVDLVVGTANKFRVLDHLESALDAADWERDRVEAAKGFLPETFQGSRYSRATIKIQDGCNFNCSFCIIPRARGRSRSLALGDVVAQIDEAERQGFQEVILTGIHIAHYGWDRDTDLLGLLRRALEKKSGPRIRLSTLDPFEVPDELIGWLAPPSRLCPHLHIALQSGSDRVLKAMKRIYKAAEFEEVGEKIQRANPNAFVGVDVIVGFPGETDAEFEQTVACLERSYWTKLHVFPYSERPGTGAAALEGKVAPATIQVRSGRLRKMSERRYLDFLSSQVGRECAVILERPSRKRPGVWLGHTENYLPALAALPHASSKQLVPLRSFKAEGERIWVS